AGAARAERQPARDAGPAPADDDGRPRPEPALGDADGRAGVDAALPGPARPARARHPVRLQRRGGLPALVDRAAGHGAAAVGLPAAAAPGAARARAARLAGLAR